MQRPRLGFQPTTLPQKAARNLTLTQTRIPVLYQEKKLKTISVTTHIPSPPDVVWKILTDFPTYVDWNPFITRASGDPQVGHKLSIRIVPPGGGGMTFRPRVTAVEPGQLLEWFGTLGVQGLFDGRHAFVLKPTAGGTTLTQTETFSGLLVPLMTGVLQRTKKGFENMNNALLSRAGSWPSASTQPEAPE